MRRRREEEARKGGEERQSRVGEITRRREIRVEKRKRSFRSSIPLVLPLLFQLSLSLSFRYSFARSHAILGQWSSANTGRLLHCARATRRRGGSGRGLAKRNITIGTNASLNESREPRRREWTRYFHPFDDTTFVRSSERTIGRIFFSSLFLFFFSLFGMEKQLLIGIRCMCMCCSGDAGESAGRRGSRIGDLAIPAQVTRGPRSRTCCRNNRTHLCTNSSHVSSSTAGYRRDRRGTSAFCRHRQTNLGSSRPIPTSICHLLSVRAAGYSHLYRLATTSTTTTASFASISSSSSSNSNKNSVAILYTTRPAIPISSSLRVPSERLRRDQQYVTPPCLLST